MDAYRLNLKLFFNPDDAPALADVIPIFHRWIRDHTLGDLLIDVADYSQVPNGPGVMLIGHEAQLSLDATDGRFGLLYARRRPQSGTFPERLRANWLRLLESGQALERETGISIPTDRLAIRVQDRLLAPSHRETYTVVEPAVRHLMQTFYGDVDIELAQEQDPRACFGVRARAAASPRIGDLLATAEESAQPQPATTWQPGHLAGRQVFVQAPPTAKSAFEPRGPAS